MPLYVMRQKLRLDIHRTNAIDLLELAGCRRLDSTHWGLRRLEAQSHCEPRRTARSSC